MSASTTGESPSIDVRGVVHRYGDREALAGLDFEVPPRRIFGLLGPNGSGKSTLFRILSTLLAPTSGTASIGGLDVVRDSASVRRTIGVAFQSPSLDIKLSCFENLLHRGHMYGLSGATLKTRAEELLDRFGLAGRHGDRVETLSGGLKRRVELAATLLHRPSVLLLDEPATGLDPGARQDLWGDLVRLRDEEGVTVALTTHLMEEADRCDQLVILHQGNKVAEGTPDSLRKDIGGDVLDVTTLGDVGALAESVRTRLDVETKIVDGSIRIEHADAHRFLATLVDAFSDEIDSVRIGKPTLADVFLQQTGHVFDHENEREANA